MVDKACYVQPRHLRRWGVQRRRVSGRDALLHVAVGLEPVGGNVGIAWTTIVEHLKGACLARVKISAVHKREVAVKHCAIRTQVVMMVV